MRKPLIAATLVGLLAVVALGSRSRDWLGDEGPREISPTALDYAFTLGLIVLVAMIIATIIGIRSLRGEVRAQRVGSMRQLIAFLVVLGVIWYIGLKNAQLRPPEEAEADDVFGPPRPAELEDARVSSDRRPVELKWWLVVLAGVAGGGAVIWYRRKSRHRPRDGAELVGEQLRAVLTQTLDDLLELDDPRRAVIRAYARMEGVLDAHGFGRHAHEAPLEYLARVLRELSVRAEAAHALTELFEVAKFSDHEIDEAMKQEAIDALATVRDDLKMAA